MMNHRFLIVGAGFSGAVLARQLAEALPCHVAVMDARSHIAGNCHTARDAATGIMVHQYGPHIFNTDNEAVWDYVRAFGEWIPYENRVKAVTPRGIFSMPINLLTINQLFGKVMSPAEARAHLAGLGESNGQPPQNFEEQALQMFGRELYETFFLGYTLKQWGCHPRELPASILQRLPVRFNYNDNYYNKRFQAIPKDGYTAIIERILDHPRITVALNQKFLPEQAASFDHVFYTGAIDAFFGYRHGRLGYRTVTFERLEAEGDYQGAAIINYTAQEVPYTRIHEHKHFTPWEEHERTVAFREYSKETGPEDEPYYPKRLAADKALLHRYREEAAALGNVSFLGRLATYRYMDMERVIAEALEFARHTIESVRNGTPLPHFPNVEA
jgi:UDP-galactopyranose mutase